jgi:hypothetical protein
MNKILIKENSFEELLGVLNNYIIFVGKRITLVGGPLTTMKVVNYFIVKK